MQDTLEEISIGFIFCFIFYFFFTWVISYVALQQSILTPYRSLVLHEIRKCEKELPRNQECEIMISAVPKQIEGK